MICVYVYVCAYILCTPKADTSGIIKAMRLNKNI